eukprot:scaffold13.g263.t1
MQGCGGAWAGAVVGGRRRHAPSGCCCRGGSLHPCPRAHRPVTDAPWRRGPLDFYWDLPPITRLLLTTYLVTGFGTFVGIFPLQYVYHEWRLIWRFPPQLWRLVTNWSYIGGPRQAFGGGGIGYLFHLMWLVQYGSSYEKGKFAHNVADGLVMLFVGMSAGMALDLCVPWFASPFHGPALVFMLVYLWSKQNPNGQSLYLPFALVFMDLVVGGDLMTHIGGILIGHTYYFLTDAVNPVHPGNAAFRAFAGRGRRLAD